MVILRKKHLRFFLRRHYPHQVKGSKVIPSSQPVYTSSPAKSIIALSGRNVNLFCANRRHSNTIEKDCIPDLYAAEMNRMSFFMFPLHSHPYHRTESAVFFRHTPAFFLQRRRDYSGCPSDEILYRRSCSLHEGGN